MLRDRTAWLLLLFVVLGVLAPAAAVVWFMNAAARSQAEIARQHVADAWRGQLRQIRDRVDAGWKSRVAALDGAANLPAALAASGAVAVVSLEAAPAEPFDETLARSDWFAVRLLERRQEWAQAATAYASLVRSERKTVFAARAAEAQVRCLARGGDREAALAAIQRYFAAGRFARAVDLDGRSIAASELLLATQLLPAGDRRRPPIVRRLAAMLEDYTAPTLPSAQRLFLMQELRAAAPDLPPFATYAAERRAAEYREAERPVAGGATLEPAGPPHLWKLTSADRRAIGLYGTAQVAEITRTLFDGCCRVIPPGDPIPSDLSAPSAMLRGWTIAAESWPATLDDAARRRTAAYLWTGYLVLAALVLAGLVAGQAFHRHLRLTRLKTDLVAAVSHELKTPLASMRLLVDTLLAEPPDPVRTRDYLELISGENLRLTRLIDNFLTFSRIERNRQSFEFRPTAPAHVVETALGAMRERLRPEEIQVAVALDLPRIRADEDAITTVLLNLLDNACKYTRGEKHIVLRAWHAGGRVGFAVEDNGIGIAPRDLKRIFRRFYQVDRSLARAAGGCGLGLSIVDFIVRAHGGEVSVKSAPGQGSTFTVLLPAEAAL